jgi:hypothetical protein
MITGTYNPSFEKVRQAVDAGLESWKLPMRYAGTTGAWVAAQDHVVGLSRLSFVRMLDSS